MPNDSYFSRLFTKEYAAFIYEVTSDPTLPDVKQIKELTKLGLHYFGRTGWMFY